ncbi:hypothetical protein IV417_16835 [Alphaproteobacteria bacterium KMM 3653]|uniref:Uncharacterized protein n=1 Tax=Harenicola maris TaxID=2841044 RepID=A0AAP2GA34_9RHOB|nr:hypothetical protein [Harenicola maris]
MRRGKAGLDTFLSELRANLPESVEQHAIDAHINDEGFSDKAPEVFDR